MEKKEVDPKAIGPYVIVRSLGKGGMGEVYLAIDPLFERQVALKRIRPELQSNKIIQSRFLREARVASALSHPSIVPILNIQTTPPDIYYTMPFVEGDTLRSILRAAKEKERGGSAPGSVGRSIPSLARIFLQVCEAVAYTHAKGIIHRDLKPENIIVGKYGEVMILDWGIADFLNQIENEDLIDGEGEEVPKKLPQSDKEDLTRPGKITGTLAYMAPERLTGKASSVQTDIYALGVILYQMLTLQLPFQRKSIGAFRKLVHTEVLVDPIEMAPYRDIPHQLAAVANRCLTRSENERYVSVEELIGEIKNYIEGRPEWTLTAELDPHRKEDWQLQENILIAKHVAITRNIDVTEWAELMISERAFADNLRIEADVYFGASGQGLGFLLSIPKAESRQNLEEGYCLWIGPEICRLSRNNVQVIEKKNLKLLANTWHQIRIEKIDDHLKFYLDGVLKLNFASHLPLAGNHVGFLHKDGDFQLKQFRIYDGSHNVLVGCLTVPNAFLSHKLYEVALEEYRRIGQSFPGRIEGREALFRAGLTLLEQAKFEKNEKIYHLALKEFEKLYRTPGAPLEYLGKSLVYEALGDTEEEAKCLELALRKFPTHPLLPVLKEHIVYRLHESSLNNREAAYRIILLAIRHIPGLLDNPDTFHLIESLEKNWETLPFLEEGEDRMTSIAIQLSFWLAKVPILVEIGEAVKGKPLLFNNVLTCLSKLEASDALKKFLPEKPKPKQKKIALDVAEIWDALIEGKPEEAKKIFSRYPEGAVYHETSPLHFPYGAYLSLTQGKEAAMSHFSIPLETPYPPTTALPSLFLTNRLKGWAERGFWWEKKELHRQIDLFYQAVGRNRPLV